MAFSHCLLFFCFFLYIWLFGDTRLIYHAFGKTMDYPFFFTGWKFLGNTIDHPGGMVEYITGFLSQFYYYPLGGAIVITIVVSLSCLAIAMLFKSAGFNFLAGVISYTPAIFFLAMHSKGEHHLLVFVGLLINLWFLILYEKIRLQSFTFRSCLFLVMLTIVYYIAGAFALLFGILATCYEIFVRRRLLLGGLYLLLTRFVPWIVGWYFDIRPMDIYTYLLPFESGVIGGTITIAKALCVSIPCIVLAMYICQSFFCVKPSKQIPADTEKKRLIWLIQPIIVVLAAIGTVFLCTGVEKKRLQANFYSSNAMWTDLLEYANRFPVVSHDPVGGHNIIQALYHTGRFASDMYSYPRFGEAFFLPKRKKENLRRYTRGIKFIRLSLQLGRVNTAEKEAYEMLENEGDIPELLWHLATINIAKNQPETSRVFLEVLSRDLIYGKKAKLTLDRLDKDPRLSDDEEIMRIRSVMRKEDSVGVESLEACMLALLEANPHNKIAFEYLMAHYLNNRQVDKVAENISRFRNFGYEKIPRHYQEAIVIHTGKTKERIALHGWQIDPETTKKSIQFRTNLKLKRVYNLTNPKLNGGNKLAAAVMDLAPDFGNTYFFYYAFNITGSTPTKTGRFSGVGR